MTDVERAVTRRVLERKKQLKHGSHITPKGHHNPKTRVTVNQPWSNTIISTVLLVVPLLLWLETHNFSIFFDENNIWVIVVALTGLVFGQTWEAVAIPLLVAAAFVEPGHSLGIVTEHAASLPFIGNFWSQISYVNHYTRGLVPALPLHLTLTWILHYVAHTSISTTECTLIAGGLTTLLLNFSGKLYQAVLICGIVPFCPTAVYLRRYISILRKRRPDNDTKLMNRLALNSYSAYLSSAAILFFLYLYQNGRFIEFFLLIGVHWTVFLFWISCFTFALLIASYVLKLDNSMLDSRRKLWHLTAVAMFWAKTSSRITPVALAVAIVLFLALEAVRAAALPPFGKQLHEALRSFVDHRDTRGPLVISHIYLLMGIAWPAFISNGSLACARAGLICLGLGDTMASQIGKRFGRLRIFGDKSLEGSIGFFIAAFAGLSLSNIPIQPALMTAAATALLEATSVINDNLVLPSYMVVILKFLGV